MNSPHLLSTSLTDGEDSFESPPSSAERRKSPAMKTIREEVDSLISSVAFKVPKEFEYLSDVNLDEEEKLDLDECLGASADVGVANDLSLINLAKAEIQVMKDNESKLKSLLKEHQEMICNFIDVKDQKKEYFDAIIYKLTVKIGEAKEDLFQLGAAVSSVREKASHSSRSFTRLIPLEDTILNEECIRENRAHLNASVLHLEALQSSVEDALIKALDQVQEYTRNKKIELEVVDVTLRKVERAMMDLEMRIIDLVKSNSKLVRRYNQMIVAMASDHSLSLKEYLCY